MLDALYDKNDTYYIVMNLCWSNLAEFQADRIQKKKLIAPYLVKRLIKQMNDILIELEDQLIYHVDFNPENILLDASFNLFICDFSEAVSFDNDDHPDLRDIFLGIPGYVAPEILTNTYSDPFAAIMWSIGVISLELMFNMQVF